MCVFLSASEGQLHELGVHEPETNVQSTASTCTGFSHATATAKDAIQQNPLETLSKGFHSVHSHAYRHTHTHTYTPTHAHTEIEAQTCFEMDKISSNRSHVRTPDKWVESAPPSPQCRDTCSNDQVARGNMSGPILYARLCPAVIALLVGTSIVVLIAGTATHIEESRVFNNACVRT
jgi:hypothetical protein